MFEKIEEAPCPAANVEKSQFALVPSRQNFMELRQRLPELALAARKFYRDLLVLAAIDLRRLDALMNSIVLTTRSSSSGIDASVLAKVGSSTPARRSQALIA